MTIASEDVGQVFNLTHSLYFKKWRVTDPPYRLFSRSNLPITVDLPCQASQFPVGDNNLAYIREGFSKWRIKSSKQRIGKVAVPGRGEVQNADFGAVSGCLSSCGAVV